MIMRAEFLLDRRRGALKLAEGYRTMSLLFSGPVRNRPAGRVCGFISWLYSLGLSSLAQTAHNRLLRPLVAPYEWNLLTSYGKKYRLI